MKKLIAILAALTMGLISRAQDIYVNLGETNRIFAESTRLTDNSTTYGYIELETGRNTPYIQLIREVKKWEAPIFFHYELRSTFRADESLFVGGTYSIGGNAGYLNISALGRWDRGLGFSPQIGETWELNAGPICFSGYADQWYWEGFNLYAEARLHASLNERIAVGFITDIIGGPEWMAIPRFSIKYNIK